MLHHLMHSEWFEVLVDSTNFSALENVGLILIYFHKFPLLNGPSLPMDDLEYLYGRKVLNYSCGSEFSVRLFFWINSILGAKFSICSVWYNCSFASPFRNNLPASSSFGNITTLKIEAYLSFHQNDFFDIPPRLPVRAKSS